MLRNGQLKPKEVPITYIERDGVKLIENTRSSLALRRANIPESAWNLINKTGDLTIVAKITERLARNELTNSGTDVLRITGEGKNASSLK
jgi:filamentous hemagglutinin